MRQNLLYRGIDKEGRTIDFYLSSTRNTGAAKRFLGKALKSLKAWAHPKAINTDKSLPAFGCSTEAPVPWAIWHLWPNGFPRTQGWPEPFMTQGSLEDVLAFLATAYHANKPRGDCGPFVGRHGGVTFCPGPSDPYKEADLYRMPPLDAAHAEVLKTTRYPRLTDDERQRLMQTEDPDEMITLLDKNDLVDPIPSDDPMEVDLQNYAKLWPPTDQLRKEGRFLKAIKDLSCPCVFIHGRQDPHPWESLEAAAPPPPFAPSRAVRPRPVA